ncbi:hypothetical protein C8Q70DRAFT_1050075 [Cubamyces menziesii]|nr:hypothetical protein C8Q70DRAFT_1050075 [Cubamyces menziesii]
MFANKFTAIVTALVAAAAAVSAAPSIVFSPPITSPKAGDVWPAGTTQTGLILLGYIEDGSEDEHLDIKNPLAVNFPISAGSASVEVPSVTPRDDYVVVLFGDSGNTSPKFTITN